ncbi:MAG: hypothetical protein V1779_09500 [bacterium]
MDIDFDSELLWDIWYYFILYGTIVIFGLSLLSKFLLYTSLNRHLGKNYQSLPDLSKTNKWRKYLLYLMILLSFLMLMFTLLRMESFLYLIPVLFVTGIVYLNGKIKGNFWDILTTFFYDEKGFCRYPGRNKIFSLSFYKWSNVEKVKIKKSGSVKEFKVKIKEKKGFIKIRSRKKDAESIKNIFIEKGIVVE